MKLVWRYKLIERIEDGLGQCGNGYWYTWVDNMTEQESNDLIALMNSTDAWSLYHRMVKYSQLVLS